MNGAINGSGGCDKVPCLLRRSPGRRQVRAYNKIDTDFAIRMDPAAPRGRGVWGSVPEQRHQTATRPLGGAGRAVLDGVIHHTEFAQT